MQGAPPLHDTVWTKLTVERAYAFVPHPSEAREDAPTAQLGFHPGAFGDES